jgi:subfamily B ATP-binding cassette protein MsbA
LTRLVLQLVRPYRGWLVIVFIAMLAEIAMSLAAPWPLKLVLDDALEHHKLPAWLAWAHDYGIGRSTLGVALFAGLSTLLIALIAAIATYVDNYYTSSVVNGWPTTCVSASGNTYIGSRFAFTTTRRPGH